MGDNGFLQRKTISRDYNGLVKILKILGETFLPDIEAGDFLNDQPFEPSSDDEKKIWHREVGVKLSLRIIDRVFTIMCEENAEISEELDSVEESAKQKHQELQAEIESLRSKNLALEAQIEQLSDGVKDKGFIDRNTTKDVLSTTSLLDIVNQSAEDRVDEFEDTPYHSRVEMARKNLKFPNGDGERTGEPSRLQSKQLKRKRKQEDKVSLFSKRGKSEIKPVPRSKEEDRSFVPETMALNGSVESPVQDRGMVVPDTPEKNTGDIEPHRSDSSRTARNPLAASNLPIPTIDLEDEPGADEGDPPPSPVFAKVKPSSKLSNVGLSSGRLRRTNKSSQKKENPREGKENRDQSSEGTELKAGDIKEAPRLESPQKSKNMPGRVGGGRAIEVNMISPKQQKEIDKKTWMLFQTDFSSGLTKKDSQYIDMDEEDSDAFESPNLLKLKPDKKRCFKDEDDISIFSSPPELPVTKTTSITKPEFSKPEENKVEKKKLGAKSKVKKGENRWGIEVDEITSSQKKRLKNQRQSTLDGYFNKDSKDKPRKLKTNLELEMAMKLSKEEYDKQQRLGQLEPEKEKSKRTERRSSETRRSSQSKDATRERSPKTRPMDAKRSPRPKETRRERSPITKPMGVDTRREKSPGYKYVGPTVRKREERAKLKGFDCRECEEYYRGKLEEGFTEEQVMQLMNDCSKHRARYKPPLTPEKFWDPEIIEGDPNSPRNKTQTAPPLRTRAIRRKESRERRKIELKGKAQENPGEQARKEPENPQKLARKETEMQEESGWLRKGKRASNNVNYVETLKFDDD